ncbi:MAG: FHA domain-containing protein [Bacteriovoracales bacterium]|nr:FHA domain-containing protein [Bacteriovoracales bacterium]
MLDKKETPPIKENHSKETPELIIYNSGMPSKRFSLEEGNISIGSHEECLIHLKDPSASPVHACLIVDEKGQVDVYDLNSKNGTFINDKKITKGELRQGDSLKIGRSILGLEKKKTEIEADAKTEIKKEGPSIPISNEKSTLREIDGELCDIIFDDSSFKYFDSLPTQNREFKDRSYIDFDDEKDRNEKDIYDIVEKKYRDQDKDQLPSSLEVTICLNGHILSVDYLPLNIKRTHHLYGLDQGAIHVDKNSIEIKKSSEIKARYLVQEDASHDSPPGNVFKVNEKDILSLEWKATQVFIRHSYTPPRLKTSPFFMDESQERKKSNLIFASLLSIALLLLFVDTPKEEKKVKKISVIYKMKLPPTPPTPPTEIPTVSKQEPAPTPPSGTPTVSEQKPTPTPPPPPKTAKKGPPSIKKKTKPKKKMASPPKKRPAQKSVAKKIPSKKPSLKKKKSIPKPTPPPTPVKKYSFSGKGRLKNLLNKAKSAKNNRLLRNTTVLENTNTPNISSKTSRRSFSSKSSSNSKISAGLRGKYDQRISAKRLSSKRKISSLKEVSPPKVLIGSMDPDLLRGLLREYMPQFKHCYKRELQRNKKFQGVLNLNFRINRGGRLSKIFMKGERGQTFGSRGQKCIRDVLALIQFPSPKGGGVVDVKQPLNFKSSKVLN